MLKNKAELSDEGRGSWGGGVIWDKAIVESFSEGDVYTET